MNLVEKIDGAKSLPCTLRNLREWAARKGLCFNLDELQTAWVGRTQTASLELFKSCYQSAGVTLVLSDSRTGFCVRLILDDKEAVFLQQGLAVDFSDIDAVYCACIPAELAHHTQPA